MNIKRIFILILLTVFTFGCEKDETEIIEGKEIAFNVIEEGTFAVSEDNTINEQYLVFNDEKEWSDFISLMEFKSPEKAEDFKKKDFDFSSKTLLIITSAHGNSCCKEIFIKKVYRYQGIIHVKFEVEASNDQPADFHQSYLLFEVDKE